ncbi:hypothetical protein HDV02_001286 [Globomyces sp. JEL0801]|nr:hypothetical protein HDV02_001286 [Globomyces sp. JEL0801]
MTTKRFLNIQFGGETARINITDMEDLSEVKKEIKTYYGEYIPGPVVRIQLWMNTGSENIQVKTWSQLKALPPAYFEEESLSLTVELLPLPNARELQGGSSLLTAGRKKPLAFDEETTDQVKKRRLSISKNLVDTSGADFVYSDRTSSMKVLADCLAQRHVAWKEGKTDRNLHPIPFLADGPGSGKSRFLQELPSSLINLVSQGGYSQEFKNIFKSPVCIKFTFSNGTPYTFDEAEQFSVHQSICLRILYQYETGYSNFQSFYNDYKSQEFILSRILEKVGTDASCIILGIDELNKVYEIDLYKQKDLQDIKERLLSELFRWVGSLSCEFSPFFIPVLAGTVIGPIKSVVRKSTHPPLHIPLPLLSFESCLNIFAKKNTMFSQLVQTSRQLRQLISDCGGHCRSLEILFDGMLKINHSSPSFWDDVTVYVRHCLNERYDLSNYPLGSAIALSFLGRPVKRKDSYPEHPSLNIQDLEERGLIK